MGRCHVQTKGDNELDALKSNYSPSQPEGADCIRRMRVGAAVGDDMRLLVGGIIMAAVGK